MTVCLTVTSHISAKGLLSNLQKNDAIFCGLEEKSTKWHDSFHVAMKHTPSTEGNLPKTINNH